MKIVQVYKDYEPPVFGGVEHTMRLLSRGLARIPGYQSTVVCSWDRPVTRVEQLEETTVVRVATFGRLARSPVSPTLPGWLRRLQPDILHFHYPNPTGEMSCLVAGPRCPVVVTYHADVVRQRQLLRVYRHPLARFFRRADRILVTSPYMLDGNALLEPHRDRCRVIPIGIDLGRMEDTPRARQVAAEVRARCAAPVVLFVGRMRPYKGLPVLVEAMREVPGTLLLVGSGEQEARVRERIQALGLESRVVMTGDVPDADLPGYYRAADLFVLPSVSRSEAFGLAMVEAMSCGLPVVSTRLGTGTSFVNQDGVTGLEVPAGDPGAMAVAMRRLLSNREEARRMGESARARALTLGSEAMVAQIVAQYEELAGRRSGRAQRGPDFPPAPAGVGAPGGSGPA